MYKIVFGPNGTTKYYGFKEQFLKWKLKHQSRYRAYLMKCYEYVNNEWKEYTG